MSEITVESLSGEKNIPILSVLTAWSPPSVSVDVAVIANVKRPLKSACGVSVKPSKSSLVNVHVPSPLF